MNKRFNILTIVGLTLIIGLLPSCGGKPTNTNYDETAKLFAADKSISPVMDEAFNCFYNKTQRSLYPLYMSEQEAIDSLLELKVYLVFTTRKLTTNEENIIRNQQHNPRQQPLAYDGMALIVNRDNPDTLMLVDNFKKILKVTSPPGASSIPSPNSTLSALCSTCPRQPPYASALTASWAARR